MGDFHMKNYLPQLDIAFYNYWRDCGEITVADIPTPVIYVDNLDQPANIFNMLFDNNYSYPDYSYMFQKISVTNLPQNIVSRVMVKGSMVTCYRVCVNELGDELKNVLNITGTDVVLLDHLLSYRYTGTADISGIEFEELDTELSELIYIYLDVYVNKNFKRIPDLNGVEETNKTLTELYRFYVINECHKLLKISDVWLDNVDTNYHINRKNITVTQDIIDGGIFVLDNPAPLNDKSQMYIMYNGIKLLDGEFDLIDIDGVISVKFTDSFYSKYTLKVGDIFIVQYYSEELGVIIGTPIVSKVYGSGDTKLQEYKQERPPTYYQEHTVYNIEDYI